MNLTYLKNICKLVRVEHWVKNTLLFLPMFFNKELANTENIILVLISFFSFSFITSSIYCINDIVDLEFDKKHIQKKKRPIANGIISKSSAKYISLIIGLLSLAIAIFFINIKFTIVILLYFSLNILYTFVLKKSSL